MRCLTRTLTVLLFLVFNTTAIAATVIKIGIISDGPWARFQSIQEEVKAEIIELTAGEFEVQFPKNYTINGGWSLPAIQSGFTRLLQAKDVDLVLALGVVSSHVATHTPNLVKPVIAPFVVHPMLQGLQPIDGKSGRKNLNYLTSTREVSTELKTYQKVARFKHMAVLVDGLFLQAMPGLPAFVQAIEKKEGIRLTLIPVNGGVAAAQAAISEAADAVWVTPLLRWSDKDIKVLAKSLVTRKLPSFSMWGREEVELGLLASMVPAADQRRMARRIALNVQSILLKQPPESLSVEFSEGEQLTLNMATARAIGIWPTWDILASADLIEDEPPNNIAPLSLSEAVKLALQNNLDLSIAKAQAEEGKGSVKKARAGLLPNLQATLNHVRIDADRAEASFGGVAEKETSGQLVLSQALLDETVWAGYRAEQLTQEARDKAFEQKRLDVALEAATAYLNVLRAQTVGRISKENLKLTRSNLDSAKSRFELGAANPSELYRWESEVANRQNEAIAAQSATRQAINAFNRVVQRPLEHPFVASAISLSDSTFSISDPRFHDSINNPWKIERFKEFMVGEGLRYSIEIMQQKSLLAAQQRILQSAKRAFWLPKLQFQAQYKRKLAESGAGTDSDEILEEFGLGDGLDNNEWAAEVSASLPLFTGGARRAEVQKAQSAVSRLEAELDATRAFVEQRIRASLHRADASLTSIEWSQKAAVSARKNLELVKDAYSRGVVSVLDLLDAQNAALISEQSAANAVYDFMADYMQVQRAIGRYDFLLSQAEREAGLQRLERYLQRSDQ